MSLIRETKLDPFPLQIGHGIPTHISPIGTHYLNIDSGLEYQNKDGIVNWVCSNSGGSGASISNFNYNNNNIFSIIDTSGNTFSVLANVMSGLTVNGNLFSNIFSATTYQNLPRDIYVTGGTYSNNNFYFSNNSGGTFNINNVNTMTGLTINGAFKYIDGNQLSTKILTSDDNGNASWQFIKLPGNLIYFFSNLSADTLSYYQAKSSVQTQSLEIITNNSVINNQILASFITDSNEPNLTFIPNGIVTLHIHAANTNSGKQTQLYFQIFKRTSGGTETLLGTSSYTDSLGNAQSEYNTDLSISATTLNLSDRLVFKIYSSVTGVGVAPDISLYLADNTLSRIQVPSAIVNTTNYVPYSGANNNLNLGAFGLYGNTISATTYQNLPRDVYVTGGTYASGVATFTNTTGGTFNVTGFKTDDVYVTGGTLTNGITTFRNNTGGTFNVSGYVMAYSGTASLDFGSPISGETSYTSTTINNTNITANSNVIIRVITSTNHPDIEDSLIDGLTFTNSNIIDGVSFTLNAFASQDTWGVYNIMYRIIN